MSWVPLGKKRAPSWYRAPPQWCSCWASESLSGEWGASGLTCTQTCWANEPCSHMQSCGLKQTVSCDMRSQHIQMKTITLWGFIHTTSLSGTFCWQGVREARAGCTAPSPAERGIRKSSRSELLHKVDKGKRNCSNLENTEQQVHEHVYTQCRAENTSHILFPPGPAKDKR